MKNLRFTLAAFAAFCLIAVAAFAADASPAGTWKYTQAGRGGGPGVERTLILDLKDGKLTGTLKGASMGQFEIPDAAISDASFKDGSTEAPGRDGNAMKRDWKATRAK
jgi:hypothetical protein